MIIYRTARAEHAATDYDLLSGEGAKKYPGRWNLMGDATVYCTESERVAFAEAGFYEIILNLEILRGAGTVADNKSRELLLGRQRILARIEVDGVESHLVDISTPALFDIQASRHRVKIEYEESRLSDITAVASRTRALATAIRKTGAPGLVSRCARAEGRCVVLFRENLSLRLANPRVRRFPVEFSASNSGSVWGGVDSGLISDSEVMVTHSLGGVRVSEPIEVLHFS